MKCEGFFSFCFCARAACPGPALWQALVGPPSWRLRRLNFFFFTNKAIFGKQILKFFGHFFGRKFLRKYTVPSRAHRPWPAIGACRPGPAVQGPPSRAHHPGVTFALLLQRSQRKSVEAPPLNICKEKQIWG